MLGCASGFDRSRALTRIPMVPIKVLIVASGTGLFGAWNAYDIFDSARDIPVVEKTVDKATPIIGKTLRVAQEHTASLGTRLHQKVDNLALRTGDTVEGVSTRVRQKWGTIAFKSAVASSALRNHMPDLYQKQGGIDALCGVPLPNLYVGWPWKRRLNPLIHVDHKRPRSRGGSDAIHNLQLTHATFNFAKGNLYDPALSRAKRVFCPVNVKNLK